MKFYVLDVCNHCLFNKKSYLPQNYNLFPLIRRLLKWTESIHGLSGLDIMSPKLGKESSPGLRIRPVNGGASMWTWAGLNSSRAWAWSE